MKYDSFETKYCEGKEGEKIYRNCLLLDLKSLELIDGPDDMIVSGANIPKDAIILDAGIAEIIQNLIKKGYKTVYSCQGHLDKDIYKDNQGKYHSGISAPYILIEAGEYLDRYISHIFQLPIQFEVEIDDNICDTAVETINKTYWNYRKTVDSSKKRITIRSKMSYIFTDEEDGLTFDVDKLSVEKFNTYNAMDLIALAEWVNNLPDLTKESIEFSNALYDERIIDHETAKQCGFDFESIQEYAADIKESYNIAADSIKEINEHLSVLADRIDHIGKRLSSINLVDNISEIDKEDDKEDIADSLLKSSKPWGDKL